MGKKKKEDKEKEVEQEVEQEHNLEQELAQVVHQLCNSYALRRDALLALIFGDKEIKEEFILERLAEVEAMGNEDFEKEIKNCGYMS